MNLLHTEDVSLICEIKLDGYLMYKYRALIIASEVENMIYKLPSGQLIDTSMISSVSTVRDLGKNPKTIDTNLIGFTIRMKGREIIDVTDDYHFCDWAEVKKNLKHIREEIENLCLEEKDYID
ncbi:MAG: hypothetical protein RBS43_08700 [Candidatus Cloacimonas sp.]|nr:hypothetical protein [Candidatus Cloacimonas sp.]